MQRLRVVIVGASLAGATVAATLREDGFDGDIRLIGAEPQLPYSRPPLSKAYLRGEEGFEAQLVKPAGYYTEQRIELMLGTRVTALDAKQKLVTLEDREPVAYDQLVVATGGRNRAVSVPGGQLPGIFQLRTVEDCDRIRAVAPASGQPSVASSPAVRGASTTAPRRTPQYVAAALGTPRGGSIAPAT